ncbi:MAG: hypothetical protein ACOH19_01705 [Rhodoglobus sp.]
MTDLTENRRKTLTLLLGGGALIASTVLALSLQPLTYVLPGTGIVWAVIYSGGLALLALGIRGTGSVTQGQPLGTVALVGLAVWLLVGSIISVLTSGPDQNLTESFGTETVTFGTIDALIRFILALAASVGVLRSKAIPAPWNRVPLWCLAAVTLIWVALAVYGVTAPANNMPMGLVLSALAGATTSIGSVLLGGIAVTLADRVARSTPEKPIT